MKFIVMQSLMDFFFFFSKQRTVLIGTGKKKGAFFFFSFSHSVMSDVLQPHGL